MVTRTRRAPPLRQNGSVAFTTSRLVEFVGEKELVAQIGHLPDEWPLVVAKELIEREEEPWPTRFLGVIRVQQIDC